MFKNKMNAWGFILITALWVVLTLLALVQVPRIEGAAMYLSAIMVFFFFLVARTSNNGFAIVGLIVGLMATGSAGFMNELAGGGMGGMAMMGIAYLFFAFAFIKDESKVVNLVGWAQILTYVLVGLFGFWGVGVLTEIFSGIGNIVVGLLFIYYLASMAGVNLPGGFDEKVKETIG